MNLPSAGALIDLFGVLLAAFIAMANPPVPPTQDDSESMCQLMVEVHWADGLKSDVDLWVQAPGDVPVGYSNKGSGKVFNLLRDDLGLPGDSTQQNFEISCTRGLPDGEYRVNLHMYRVSDPLPIPAEVRVAVRHNGPGRLDVLTESALLEREGQEITVMRFEVRDGRIVSGSKHRLPIGLRSQVPPPA